MLQNLSELARKQPIDTDYVVSQTQSHTHLLLRLGEEHEYPTESHSAATEHILVLEGHCFIQVGKETYTLKRGEMISIEPSLVHQFMPQSECLLSVNFVANKEQP